MGIDKIRKVGYIQYMSYNKDRYHNDPEYRETVKQRSLKSYHQRAERIRAMKEEAGCHDCGEAYPHYMMQFDHTDGSTRKTRKYESITNIRKEADLMAELEKGDFVCANCHAARTWVRQQEP